VTYRSRNIVLAVALAALAAALTSFYVSNYKKTVRDGEKNVTVFVATKDIPAGTSGAGAAASLRPVQVARRNVVPGAISRREQVSTLIATDAIYSGEQVSQRRFRPVTQGGVRAELKGNLRAVQLAGDPNQLLAGTLKAGDRVDVLASIKYKVSDVTGGAAESGTDLDRVASRVVLRDLLVLRADSAGSAASRVNDPTGKGASVQLAVTDNQAQKLFFVYRNGDWSLQLRPVVDATDSSEGVETIESVLGDGLHARQYAQLYGRGGR
jgi:Flp pilus assembly protein CpaB